MSSKPAPVFLAICMASDQQKPPELHRLLPLSDAIGNRSR
jgi:hypothetical protein